MVPSLARSWIVWACAALFFCYQFLLRVSPSVMTHELMTDLHMDACTLGLLTSFYFYGYAGFQLPVGSLLDKFGPRRLLVCAALTCTGGSFLFSSADTVFIASLSRFLIGAGSAFGFLSCMKLGTLWFPPQRIAIIVGLTLLLGTSGGMSGSYPMSFLVDAYGWREAVWLTALGGVFIALLAAFIVRDHPPKVLENYINQHHAIGNPSLGILEGLITIIKKPQTWLLAFYGFMMYVPLAGFADMWGVPFLTHVHHMDKQSASLATTLLYMGVGIGTPLSALLSDYLKQYKATLLTASLGALFAFMLIVYGPTFSTPITLGILLFAGVMLGGQFMAFSIVCEINPLSVSGMATGFQNLVSMTSGIILQPLIGWFLDFFWESAAENGIRLYSAAAYQMALTSLITALVLATLAAIFIREAYPERE
jgi:sugar phosphate permease